MRVPQPGGINPQDRKWEQGACALDGSQHRFLTPVQEGQAFRPPGGHVGKGQRIQVAALDIGATMGHQIGFQKAGLGLLPLLERTYRNLLLSDEDAHAVRALQQAWEEKG